MLKNLLNKIKYFLMIKEPVKYARSLGVNIGENCRLIDINIGTFGSEPFLVKLGNHVTITSGVKFITHDGGVWVFREKNPLIDVISPIVIGNNVFVGLNVIILPGVTIGDNCVIGAGSIVSRDIPDNTIAAGVPARKIKDIDDYWKNVKDRAIFIRGLPEQDKRKFLQNRFRDKLGV